MLGRPYLLGAAGPNSFDCSGLVQWAAGRAGFHGVPRTSEAQYGYVQHISQSQLQPGDLVFSQWPGDGPSPGHVQIYAGGGQVIGADTSDVQLISLDSNAGHIVGFGRLPGVSAQSGGGGGGGLFGSLLSLPSDVLALFDTGEQLVSKLLWLVNPENWARIVAGFAGMFFLVFGLGFLVVAAR